MQSDGLHFEARKSTTWSGSIISCVRSLSYPRREEELIAQIREGYAKLQADANSPDPEYVAARAALEERVGVYGRAVMDSGFAEAEEAHEAAVAGEFDAEMAVLAAEPTTLAGALALLRFIANQLDGIADDKTIASMHRAFTVKERGSIHA